MDAKNEVKEKLDDSAAEEGNPGLRTLTHPDDEPSILIDLRPATSGPIKLGSDFEPHVAEDDADSDSEDDLDV